MNYNVKNVGRIESIKEVYDYIDNDIYSCVTLSDIITNFNFWYGFLQGWFNSSDFGCSERQRCFNYLKDNTLEMIFLIDGGDQNV